MKRYRIEGVINTGGIGRGRSVAQYFDLEDDAEPPEGALEVPLSGPLPEDEPLAALRQTAYGMGRPEGETVPGLLRPGEFAANLARAAQVEPGTRMENAASGQAEGEAPGADEGEAPGKKKPARRRNKSDAEAEEPEATEAEATEAEATAVEEEPQ